MNKEIIRSFWQEMAGRKESNRWTSMDILDYEKEALSAYFMPAQRVLDLGSGNGELSRALTNLNSKLVAVDFIDDYAKSFSRANEVFVCSSLLDYDPSEIFDIALLFGVVTYLSAPEEMLLYEKIKGWLAESGVALIKNQCAANNELLFEGYSPDLGRDYCSRYPAFEAQLEKLSMVFANVKPIKYPSRFNKWENTFHVLFECSG